MPGAVSVGPAPQQPPNRSKWRRIDPWALVGFLIFVGIVTVVNHIVHAPGPRPAIPLPASTGSAPGLHLSDYQPGDCLLGGVPTGGSWPDTMHQVPCAQPHDYEVFYANSGYWPQDRPYPGASALQAQADDQCARAYTSYDGLPLSKSDYTDTVISPSRTSWHNGSRALECVGYTWNFKAAAGTPLEMTGSIRGTYQ